MLNVSIFLVKEPLPNRTLSELIKKVITLGGIIL